jgi:hypothetical protein
VLPGAKIGIPADVILLRCKWVLGRLPPRPPGRGPDPARAARVGIEAAAEYRYGAALYAITVHDPGAIYGAGAEMSVDGARVEGAILALVDDGARHEVTVRPRAADVRDLENAATAIVRA